MNNETFGSVTSTDTTFGAGTAAAAAPTLTVTSLDTYSGNKTHTVPVGMSMTRVSASFLIVTSLVEPCPVMMIPSAAV